MIAIVNDNSMVFANKLNQRKLDKGLNGRIRENVRLCPVPDDLNDWPEGSEAPQAIVGKSETEPDLYRVFKFESELEGSGFRSTGKHYGGAVDVYPKS